MDSIVEKEVYYQKFHIHVEKSLTILIINRIHPYDNNYKHLGCMV